MEALQFRNLSKTEKIVLFQKLLNRDEGDTEEKVKDDEEKSNFSLLLESFKDSYHKNIPEDKVKEEISKGKQKTLDNWLVKRENVSSPEKEVGETSHTSNMSEDTSHAEPIVQMNHIDIDSVNVSRKRKTSKNRVFIKKPNMNKNVSEEKESIVSSRRTKNNKKSNEKYNLRSKRKVSEQQTVSQGSKCGIKCLKLADIQKDSPVMTDWDINNQINNFDDSSCTLSAKENDKFDKSSSVENEKHNCRTKKKNLELSQSVRLNNITDQIESTSQITQALTSSSEPLSNITSPSPHSYEAFCLLRRTCDEIGINIMDVLTNKNIQTLLNDDKNVNSDAIVFIGSSETETGEKLPVVHLAQSKTVLLKKLNELKI